MQGIYADPDLTLQQHPAQISDNMLDKVGRMLQDMQWGREDVVRFLGRYLSEPKSHVWFEASARLNEAAFRSRLQQEGIVLDLRSQLLFHEETFFMNGEETTVPAFACPPLQQLADSRALQPGMELDASLMAKLYDWYLAGYLHFANDEDDLDHG